MKNRHNLGFSLVELIIVIAIMGTLSAILAPQYFKFVKKSQETKAIQYCEQVVHSATIELINSDNTISQTDHSNSISLLPYSTYMSNVYDSSGAATNSIEKLNVNTNSMTITYAQYTSEDDITVYFNGSTYSLAPTYGSEYVRLVTLLSNSDVSSKDGYARTKALQALALSTGDGTYTDLTLDEISALQDLVSDKALDLRSEVNYENLEWIPISNTDGSDVMMVISNSQGTDLGSSSGYFIYYKGHYFYKAHQTSGDRTTLVGGSSYIPDSGTLDTQLESAISDGNSDNSYWKLLN